MEESGNLRDAEPCNRLIRVGHSSPKGYDVSKSMKNQQRRRLVVRALHEQNSTDGHLGLGLRELKKLDKLRRIKAAAANLFTTKGFDATTTAEIAERAGVGEGTIFLYASEKRDLLFDICMDELEETRNKGFAKIRRDMPLLEQLLVPEVVMYRQLAKNIPLERIFFEELTFCSGPQAERLRASRLRMISRIEQLLLAAQQRGHIRCDEDPAFVARHIFFSSQSAMRWWISGDKPKVSDGIADLRRIYTVHLRALNPTRAAFGSR
jgi:AcrR family transcriptional regulator